MLFWPTFHKGLVQEPPRLVRDRAWSPSRSALGSHDIVEAKLVGKLVACTPPLTLPGFVLAPSALIPCCPSLQ